jgi:hypothetical protein
MSPYKNKLDLDLNLLQLILHDPSNLFNQLIVESFPYRERLVTILKVINSIDLGSICHYKSNLTNS